MERGPNKLPIDGRWNVEKSKKIYDNIFKTEGEEKKWNREMSWKLHDDVFSEQMATNSRKKLRTHPSGIIIFT